MRRRGILVAWLAWTGGVTFLACVGSEPDLVPPFPDGSVTPDVATSESGSTDTGTLADVGVGDGGDATTGPACDLDGQFTSIGVVAEVSSIEDEVMARLSDDELVLYIEKKSAGADSELWFATRASKADKFGQPTSMGSPPNSGANDQHPAVTKDGLRMYVTIDSRRILVSTRGTTDAGFPAPQPSNFDSPDANSEDRIPYLTPSSTLFFSSSRETPGSVVLFRATYASPGMHNPPQRVLGLGTPLGQNEEGVAVTADEGILYFARNVGSGDYDIFMAKRTDAGEYTPGVAVAELNVEDKVDYPSWVSPDGCRLYFISNRTAASSVGKLDIWSASRPPK